MVGQKGYFETRKLYNIFFSPFDPGHKVNIKRLLHKKIEGGYHWVLSHVVFLNKFPLY